MTKAKLRRCIDQCAINAEVGMQIAKARGDQEIYDHLLAARSAAIKASAELESK